MNISRITCQNQLTTSTMNYLLFPRTHPHPNIMHTWPRPHPNIMHIQSHHHRVGKIPRENNFLCVWSLCCFYCPCTITLNPLLERVFTPTFCTLFCAVLFFFFFKYFFLCCDLFMNCSINVIWQWTVWRLIVPQRNSTVGRRTICWWTNSVPRLSCHVPI